MTTQDLIDKHGFEITTTQDHTIYNKIHNGLFIQIYDSCGSDYWCKINCTTEHIMFDRYDSEIIYGCNIELPLPSIIKLIDTFLTELGEDKIFEQQNIKQ